MEALDVLEDRVRQLDALWGITFYRGSCPRSTRGRPWPQDDAWIAACRLAYDPSPHWTSKDFQDFVEHEGLVLLST